MKYDKQKFFQITDSTDVLTSELMQRCWDKFMVYSYYDDKELDKQFPPPEKATTRYFKKNVEADEEYANKSANDLKDVAGITLRERIIMELQYFEETGEHLDIKNITLCSGSRFAGGSVPGVFWGGGFRVGRGCHPADADPSLRTRVAVSLDPLTSNPSDLESRVAELETKMTKLQKFLILE